LHAAIPSRPLTGAGVSYGKRICPRSFTLAHRDCKLSRAGRLPFFRVAELQDSAHRRGRTLRGGERSLLPSAKASVLWYQGKKRQMSPLREWGRALPPSTPDHASAIYGRGELSRSKEENVPYALKERRESNVGEIGSYRKDRLRARKHRISPRKMTGEEEAVVSKRKGRLPIVLTRGRRRSTVRRRQRGGGKDGACSSRASGGGDYCFCLGWGVVGMESARYPSGERARPSR